MTFATVSGNWNQEDAEPKVDSLLKIYDDVDVIFAHNDRMAIGASGAVRKMGRDNIKIIGIDAAPEIGIKAVADGVIDATFSLSKAFVEMHGGTISVESILKKGSVFSISLPIRHVSDEAESFVSNISESDVNAELDMIENEPVIDEDKPVVLVVDDNKDIRAMVSNCLVTTTMSSLHRMAQRVSDGP